jgi:SecD/SecF fusion protein
VNRRSHLIFVGLIVAGLIGVALLAIPGSPLKQEPTLGLDLQGGLEVTLQAVPPPNRPLQQSDLERSVEILRDRIDALGVAEPEIRESGDDQISIGIPGVKDPERVIEILGKTAQLELYDLQENLQRPSIDANGFPVATPSVFQLLAGQQALIKGDNAPSWYLFNDKKKVVAGPRPTKQELLESEVLEEARGEGASGDALPKGWRIFGVPPGTVVLECGRGEVVCPGVNVENPTQDSYYLMKYDRSERAIEAEEAVPEMTGEDLRLSGTRQDFDPDSGEPIVTMQFTDRGGDRFGDITADIARRGRTQSQLLGQTITQNFAIVLDREIKSWPSIDWEQYPNGIGGSNGAQITGIGSIDEAKDLAIVLQSGALPVTFQTLETTAISATLGEDSLREAWRAAIAGLIVVAIFLLVFYRFLGLVAVIGLGVYAAFLYATILIFDVTLTLPGFAGMILTLGVAADANIVIFERIKEEARAGKSVRAAVANGYAKGFKTILDANVVTAITAVILFVLATSGVRGFAFLLLLGTALSIVTAVFATRAMLGLLGNARWFDNPRFMGAGAREIPAWQRVDFVGKRRIWFITAGILITLSLASIAIKGLNLGIDFDGGTEVTFSTPQPTALADVRQEAANVGQGAAQIQGTGDVVGDERYSQFRLRTESLEQAEQTQLTRQLADTFETEDVSVRNVSASFSDQILRSAIYAILFSFLCITIYITLRFEWRFAVPILRTIANDGLIALGIYSLSGREVTAATVAAFLTIIGYSIYDTIIVFDRVRENMVLMRRSTFAQIVNVSLWETIPRSLATTFITLLPVATLFFFGGETLQDFAFAVLVGIGISAFSTFFIAAPFLSVLKEREPEYKRRLESAKEVTEDSVGLSLREAEQLAADAPAPDLIPDELIPDALRLDDDGDDGDDGGDGGDGEPPSGVAGASSKRERRRQRRSSRPHGRSR